MRRRAATLADDADHAATPAQLRLLRRTLGADASITGAYLHQGGHPAMQRIRVDVRLVVRMRRGTRSNRVMSYTATGDDLFDLVSQLGRDCAADWAWHA